MHVALMAYTSGFGMFDPDRARKLLLHQNRNLGPRPRDPSTGPLTLVPLSRPISRTGRAKVELALARGRRAYDKRRAIADREAKEEARREMGTHRERRERTPRH